ncbi:MAG: SgcJ/EcaC family oxidoreductase [Acidobacteriaceae bacterium]|nr:SgcJ/EcaC family oxidoreductase [Acidobacteriaceae bacterium]MBV9778342.1 SgcJ/EcaC family oxidoreductase [Acidobacteriaceae bacterium]
MTFRFLCWAALSLTASLLHAADAGIAIRQVLTTQVEAWNRGDVDTFVTTYAEDCTFVGKQMLHGRANVLTRYKKAYPTPESMGKLTFENLDVRQLDEHIAIATGEWHLERSANSGGPVGGVFSLVLRSENGSWWIILDHTS